MIIDMDTGASLILIKTAARPRLLFHVASGVGLFLFRSWYFNHCAQKTYSVAKTLYPIVEW